MLGIYFSGTGNTKHCIELFIKEFDAAAKCISIEDARVLDEIHKSDFIVLAYPIYFSNLPKIVRDFILQNKTKFMGKKVFIIATMGLFSGDGTGCSARLLAKCGAEIVGGLHLKMPDCIGDEKALKKTIEENKIIVKQAYIKIKKSANSLKNGHATQEGIGFLYHIAGLFGQRIWFYGKTKNYSDKLKINTEKCIGCGICTQLCPMKNLSIVDGRAVQNGRCTMCYRCISNCPQQAIALLGKNLYEQCKIEKYI
ncbi:MAG: EFR1 family ferrodoxin [Oscillospiraceae bacterium]|uniref:4Fe-4S dicluster domain-containing protein n=1 Tax=Caproicibacterium lactatifermentans TaxID=2666138 RepID=A0A859DSV1_9FIRM|nr:EFR1 family ferrodoxin [Caproicibacterium lactatifermentans]MDD4510217.1 EFR1 family ferrodoxin [Oscillospiraceae bacterium]QKN23223.1 4Fe-4S dicluster domain-containing protein [Caproicibacterium lactatifermentans]